jgi:hypothetical protein
MAERFDRVIERSQSRGSLSRTGAGRPSNPKIWRGPSQSSEASLKKEARSIRPNSIHFRKVECQNSTLADVYGADTRLNKVKRRVSDADGSHIPDLLLIASLKNQKESVLQEKPDLSQLTIKSRLEEHDLQS